MLLSPWNQRTQPSVTKAPENNRVLSMPLGGGKLQEGKPHELSQADRDELQRILAVDDDAQFDAFCKVLERAIGFFKVHQAIPNPRSERGDNRRALKQLIETATKFQHQLDQLPPGAVRELDLALQALSQLDGQFVDPYQIQTSEGEPVFTASMMYPASLGTSALLDTHRTLLDRIASAVEFAQEHKRTDAGGRPTNDAEILLARDIAGAFTRILDQKPSTTAEGRYEQVLSFALTAGGLEDVENRDLHGLTRNVLRGR